MSDDTSKPRGQRLDHIVAEYLAAVASGQEPDREDLIARHADLAEDLRRFFSQHDQVEGTGAAGSAGAGPPECWD